MIRAPFHVVTCIIYVGLWGRNFKLPRVFGHHLLGELMNRKWNKWCKKKKRRRSLPTSLLLSCGFFLAIRLSVLTVCCLYEVTNSFHVSVFFLFFLFSFRTYGLHIWEMLSMVAPGPRTRCLCEVMHIWSSLLLLIITHHYYKQLLTWLPSSWLQGKKKNILNYQRDNLEGFRFTVTGCCPVRTVNSLSWSMWARHVHLDWTPLKPSPSMTPLWCNIPQLSTLAGLLPMWSTGQGDKPSCHVPCDHKHATRWDQEIW